MNRLGPLDTIFVDVEADLTGLNNDLKKGKRAGEEFSRGLSSGFKKINTSIGTTVKSLGSFRNLLIGGALATATKRSLEFAEGIGDISDRAGVSAEFLQELQFAAQKFGATSRDVNDSVNRLNRRIGLFVSTGGGPGKVAFEALGISADLLSGNLKGTEDAFNEIVKRIASIEDPAQRAALASGAFGEDAGPKLAVLLGQGSEAIQGYRQQARDLGIVLGNDTVSQAANANRALRELGLVIQSNFTNALVKAAPQIEKIATLLADSLPVLLNWVEAFAKFINPNSGLSDLEAELRTIDVQLQNINKNGKILFEPQEVTDQRNDFKNRLQSRRNVLLDLIAGEDLSNETFNNGKTAGESFVSGVNIAVQENPIGIDDIISGGEGSDDLFSGGMSDELEESVGKLEEAFGGLANDGIGTAGSALGEFVLGTGRAADVFKSFAESIIRDIARVVARFLILRALGVLGVNTEGLGGGGGFSLGGFRNNGGPVRQGQPFVVGESGRELFIPGTSGGRVLSNSQLNGLEGGGLSGSIINLNAPGASKAEVQELRSLVETQLLNIRPTLRDELTNMQRDGQL